jgi:hypothetical protein
VILGMGWLSKHTGMIDCAKKAVRLTPNGGKELEYVAENLVTDCAAFNRIVLNHLDAVSTLILGLFLNIQMFFQKNYQVCHRIMKLSLLLN